MKTTSSKGGRRSKKNKVKKNAEQYVINPEKVAANEDTRQFLMIRNIPNSISQEKLLAILETYVRFEIEFLYLPLDKTTSCNLGYGYVSLVNSASVLKLYNAVAMGALLNLDAHETMAQLVESEAVRDRVRAHPGRGRESHSETGTSRLCEDVRSVGNHERFAQVSSDFL